MAINKYKLHQPAGAKHTYILPNVTCKSVEITDTQGCVHVHARYAMSKAVSSRRNWQMESMSGKVCTADWFSQQPDGVWVSRSVTSWSQQTNFNYLL